MDSSIFVNAMQAVTDEINKNKDFLTDLDREIGDGDHGALVWMEISAAFGITSKFSECMLAVKYRETNEKGEMSGGPMYTMKNGFKNKKLGVILAFLFALFTVIASFGIGDMTQANSIAESLFDTFSIPKWLVGAVITILALIIVIGGIKSISRVSSIVVPVMAVLYLIAGIIVILGNITAVPEAIVTMFKMAFSPSAAAGGFAGTITTSVLNAAHYGVARGCFSNEAGMGSAAITAASATTDNPVRQGYINMTGTFLDTIVICSITGIAICSSGVLGTIGADGEIINGAALTIATFSSVLGETGAILITLCIAMFAFSTIIGWEYHGEKAFEYLFGMKPVMIYRVVFALFAFVGATLKLNVVWNISDIFNALMIIPNLICLLLLSGVIAAEIKAFQPEVERQKAEWKNKKKNK